MTSRVLVAPMTRWSSGVHSRRSREEHRLSSVQPPRRPHRAGLNDTLSDVARGDRSAFAQLYDAMSPAVFGLCRRILRSAEHAEEVTQEVFLEVWRKAASWKPRRAAATTWILTIARARAIDRVRSEQASRERQVRVGSRWVSSEPDVAVDELVVESEHEEVRDALSALSDKQRVVVELAYFGGKTYVEVADELDLPVGTVKTRMRDGLMRMRQHYGVDR